jgi:hypothetical protein
MIVVLFLAVFYQPTTVSADSPAAMAAASMLLRHWQQDSNSLNAAYWVTAEAAEAVSLLDRLSLSCFDARALISL